MTPTDFEGHSHEQLLAMLASLDPETVKARATRLAEAAAAIREIGDSLKKHRVDGWEGEAAHAFQDWVNRAGNATLLLGEYGAAGGRWMTQAAQTMVEVKANTPEYDTTAAEALAAAHRHHNDPDAQRIGRTAYAKLTTDHQQAVQQLTKLAQSYEQASTEMNRAEIPTFPPPPGRFAPPSVGGHTDLSRPSSGSGADSDSNGFSYVPSAPGTTAPAHESGGALRRQPVPDATMPAMTGPTTAYPSLPDPRVDMGLDNVATLPDRSLTSIPGLPGGSGQPNPPGGGWALPGGPIPSLMPSPTGGPLPATRPSVDVGGRVGGITVPPPRDSGIVGGRPISTGGPSAGIPRGTVIGAEAPQAGGLRRVPGGMGGGFGAPHGTPAGPVAGRRLAMEQGGVVGGRPAAPFTQGGSGLVRGSGVGAVGHGGAVPSAPSRRHGGQGGNRPDYLAEDEETWQANRRVVPPVID